MSIEYFNFDKSLQYIKTTDENTILYRENFTSSDLSAVQISLNNYNSMKINTQNPAYNLGEKYSQKGLPGYIPTIDDQREIDTNAGISQYNYLVSASVVTILAIGTLISMISTN